MVLSGWAAIYNLRKKASAVSREDAVVDLVAAYFGVTRTTICEPSWANLGVAFRILRTIPHLQVLQRHVYSQSNKNQRIFEGSCSSTRR